MKRFTIHFTGRVQGVGFRYTTCSVARSFNVAGTVQNLSDGRVCCVVEGEPAQLKAFTDAVLDAMQGCVRNHTIDQSDATGEFGAPKAGGVCVKH